MIANLQFDPERHLFSVDGERVPSVTQILKAVGEIDTSWFNPQARERGEVVHDITAKHDRGVLDPASVDPRLAGYYAAYLKFLDDRKPLIYAVEQIVSDEIGWYAGIGDRLYFLDETDYLVDIKTGSVLSWHRLQVHAYARCMKASRGGILTLNRNGTYKFRKVRIHEPALCQKWDSILQEYHGEIDALARSD